MTNLDRICTAVPGTNADDVKCYMLMHRELGLPYRVADVASGNVLPFLYLQGSAKKWIAYSPAAPIEIDRDNDADNWGRFLAAENEPGETERRP